MARVRKERGLTLDDWDDLSLEARYEALALHRIEATAQEWESLTRKERNQAYHAWQVNKRKNEGERK